MWPGGSAAAVDRHQAFAEWAKNSGDDPVDVIIGDWMCEANMTSAAGRKFTGKSSYLPQSTNRPRSNAPSSSANGRIEKNKHFQFCPHAASRLLDMVD